jgi:Kef-type K+ transport system membrane component KefB/predicted amino acid-binding ACT domain protein
VLIAAEGGGIDLARILLDLIIVLGVAKCAAELAERLRVPAVLGEIVAGVLIGPSVLGLIQLDGERGVSIAILAEIGVLLLLVQVGMEMDLVELSKVGRASMLVAVIGVALPFVGGAIAAVLMGEGAKTAVFVGAALTATSVGITARVFGDLRALATTEARIVIGAAVADDVLGLVILTVVVKIATGGSVGFGTVAGTLGLAVVFLVATGAFGLLFVPKLLDRVHRSASSGATVVVAAIVVIFAFAELADAAKLAFIIGAFVAGLSIARSEHHERIGSDLGAIGNILIPVFFVQIGINADLAAMAKPSVLGLAAVLTVIGVLGKLASALGASGTRVDRLLIGLGMIPRGEVGLIFASIGLANGVLDKDLYGALLMVVLVTTIITPPLLRIRIGSSARRSAATDVGVDLEPEGGWLDVVDDEVHLRAIPTDVHTISIALHTAELLDEAQPADDLLAWFGRHRMAELTWDPHDTPAFVNLLRRADTRAWRFLEVTGVLERALPEVAEAMTRRRADMRDLDPMGALRFRVVDALNDLPTDGFVHDDDLILAALAIDLAGDDRDAAQVAVDLSRRLGRAQDADRVADLVADSRLLRAGATHAANFDEPELLQLAAHLAGAAHARQAYTLARAQAGLSRRESDGLDQLVELIIEALDHPEISGLGAGNLAGSRMHAAQRLAASPAVVERLRHASTAYLLSHDPEELARQARLVEPLPRAGTIRVAVTPDPEPDMWKIDIACRDTWGLLARLTGVLSDAGLDVTYASLTTWPDGAVLDSFIARSRQRPKARDLALEMEAALRKALPKLPPPDGLELSFDGESMPWHTLCIVRGPDQPGALEAVATAFAEANVVVHTARIESREGQINDSFTVSDQIGRKLDAAAEERVRRAINGERRRRGLLRRALR